MKICLISYIKNFPVWDIVLYCAEIKAPFACSDGSCKHEGSVHMVCSEVVFFNSPKLSGEEM